MRYYDRVINYYETDQMGVVHHSNYIRYFEEARVSFMDQAGYSYERFERENTMSPVLGVECRYLKGIKFGDTVRIEVRLTKITRLKCSFSYEIYDLATGEIRAKGATHHGFIDKEGRPVVISRERPEFYETFLAELEEEK